MNIIGGWGDSISDGSTQYSSFFDYIETWVNKSNGRISQALIFATLFHPIRQYIDSPLSYPWWLIRGLCFYCTIAAPYILFITFSKYTKNSDKLLKLFFLTFLYIVWSFNSRTYESFAWFSASVFGGYALSLFLYTCFIYFLFEISQENYTKNIFKLYLFLISLFFSLLLEPYIAVIPFTIILMSFVRFSGILKASQILKSALYGLAGSIFGLIILLSSPGQASRNKSLSLGLNKLFESFIFSITYGYRYLLDYEVGSNLIVKTVVYIAHLCLFLYLCKRAFSGVPLKKLGQHIIPENNRPYIFLLAILLIYHCFFCTLIISDYFPTYLSMLPAFMLASIYAILIYMTLLSKSTGILRAWPKSKKMIYVALTLLILSLLGKHLIENRKTNLSISSNDTRRLAIYKVIEQDYRLNGTTSFAIINCPVASTKFNYSMDPPWGYTAWFEWIGIKDLKIYLQQNYDFPSNWNDGTYKIIDCEKMFN